MRKLLLAVILLMVPISGWAWTTTNYFDTATTADGWYTWNGGYGGIIGITGSQSAPGSTSNSLQVTELAGFPDSGVPGGASFVFPSPAREIWVQYYFKYSSNFRFHNSGNKQIYMWSGTDSGVIDSWYGGDPHMHPIFHNAEGWLTSNTGYNPTIDRNQWYKVVFHAKMVSAGNSVFQLWVNDGLVCDYKNITLTYNDSTDAWTKIAVDPVWGGQGEKAKTETDYQWYDHVIVSTAPIPVIGGTVKQPNPPGLLIIQ